MGEAFMMNHGGGGGGSLNFSVKNYSSDAAKPTHPRNENEIITITEIKYKNYIFSSVEPMYPIEGFVWFVTTLGGEFEFSVTKKNPILIGLQKCRQYIQGKWRNIVAYIGIEGRWLQFSNTIEPYLYQAGIDDYDNRDLTGGYTGRSSSGKSYKTISVNSSRMLINAHSDTETYGEDDVFAYTNNVIDVSDYSRVMFKVTRVYLTANYNNVKGYCRIGIANRPNGSYIASKTIESGGTYSFDLTNVRSMCPMIQCYLKNDKKQKSEIEISSILLE